jgi:hypothetical protein
MTWPTPREKESACPRFHDASNSFLFVQEYPSYWTLTVSPAAAVAPVPAMRSHASSGDGGLPEGTVTVGRVPKVPAGERSAAGIAVMPGTAAPVPVEPLADVVGAAGLAIFADATPEVELLGVDEFDEQAAVASNRAVPVATSVARFIKRRCRGMAARLLAQVDMPRCAHARRPGEPWICSTLLTGRAGERQLLAGMVSGGTVVRGTVTMEGAPPLDPFDADPDPPDAGAFPDPWVRWSRTSSVPLSAVVTKPPMLGLAMFHAENRICTSASTSILPASLSAATAKVTDLVTPCMVSVPVAE